MSRQRGKNAAWPGIERNILSRARRGNEGKLRMVDNPYPMMAEFGLMGEDGAIASPEQEAINPLEWVQFATQAENLLDYLADDQRTELVTLVKREYKIDCESMKPWREAMDAGMKLAHSLEREPKSWPWDGASNVRYPLIQTAALQFNARAYPALVPPGDVVKVATHGADQGGQKKARGERVASYTSWQLRHRMPEWEPDTDKLLMVLPVVGTMIRKTWFDPATGRPRTRLVKPGDFVVNDAVDALENAPRMSEELRLYPHEVMERQRSGQYLDGDWLETDEDDSSKPVEFIEQHRLYDVDGDGYPEPYVVIMHKDSETVVRVAANWSPEKVMTDGQRIVSIQRQDYYEDYHFVPWVGFWSMGLGLLLKDISETIDSTINRINDAATLASLGGGFVGRNARLRGGPMRFKPGEFKQVEASGDEMRSAFFQPQVPGPSPVLFEMLGLLIDAGREIANVKDISGEAQRSNQPATTTLALVEQGMAVFTAVYKRIHKAMRGEFKRLALINLQFGDPQEYAVFHDGPADLQQDFNLSDMDIEPIADPRAVTSPQKLAQAQLLMEMAQGGMIDPAAARDRMLDAAGVPDAEELQPQPDPAMQQKMQRVETMEDMAAEANVRSMMLDNVKKALEIAELEAEIASKHADAIKTMAEAEAADPMNPVAVARQQIEVMKRDLAIERERLARMAQQSGNGGGSGRSQQGGGSPAGVNIPAGMAAGGSGPAGMGAGALV